MHRHVVCGALLAGFLLACQQAEATGPHHGRGPAVAGCAGGVVYAASCTAPAYEERTVTAYRCEVKTRTVERTIHRLVTKEVEVPYTWTEMVAETTPQKRTETYYTTVTKEVPYTYMVSVPVTTPEKRTITEHVCVTKEVPYTYTVNVPVMS